MQGAIVRYKKPAFVSPLNPVGRRQAAAQKIQKAFRSSKFADARSRNSRNQIYVQTKRNSIFPSRILSKVEATATFYVAAGTIASQYYFTLTGNSYYQPFATATSYTGANNGSATNSTGGSVTDNPSGYNDAVTYYAYYKVHKYLLEVECMPTSASDPINMTMVSYNGASATNISSFSQQEIAESAWSKTRLCQNASVTNKLSMFVDCKKLLGYSSVQYKGLSPNPITGGPSSNTALISGVRWETANNTALTATLVFQVKLTQWIDLSVPDVLTAV